MTFGAFRHCQHLPATFLLHWVSMEDTQHRSVADTLFAGAAAAGAGGRKNKWHAIHVPGAPAIEPNLEDGKPA